MVSSERPGRGQLILVGAILLATIVFGLSVLLNSVLYTGAAGQTGASEAIDETDFVDYDVELGVRELVVRLNHGDRNVSADDLGDLVETNVGNYSKALGESRARSGSVAVSVGYDNDTSEFGSRIVQDHDADLTDLTGSASWDPVRDPPGGAVGWFTLNVDVQNTSTSPGFRVVARNDTDAIEIQLQRAGSEIRVSTTAPFPGGSTDTVQCEADRGRVLLDLFAGTAFTDDCSFEGIGTLDRPTSLEFHNGDEIDGRYAVVVNRTYSGLGSPSTYDRCFDPATGNGRPPAQAEPCVTPAVWSANVTTVVHGRTVQYENAYNLTVYTTNR